MHNGQFSSLEEVIEFLDHGGGASENISPLIRPLGLSAAEKADLIEFLHSLSSELPPVETGRLPE
jgi:cytochrome c peroxidase